MQSVAAESQAGREGDSRIFIQREEHRQARYNPGCLDNCARKTAQAACGKRCGGTEEAMIIGQIIDGGKLECDLPTLVDTRLLIQANSGGGKSWLLRLIAERAGIQTIVLDNEGEFASLREAVDMLLVGGPAASCLLVRATPRSSRAGLSNTRCRRWSISTS
jgi:Helicase HerA, central domain